MDAGVLHEFLALVGPDGSTLLRSVLETYIQESPRVIDDLGDALALADLDTATRLAHRLRGSCLSIGALRLAARCADLEEACRLGALPHAATYAAVITDFTATRRALKSFLRDLR